MMKFPAPNDAAAMFLSLGTCSALGLGLTIPASASAQITVFDPGNYAQNILTAARTLQQVNQQIQQLQNEAQMLVNMRKNLSRIDFPQLDAIKARLAQIDQLMSRAQAIDFKVGALDDRFAKQFPQDFTAALRTNARVRGARTRLDASMEAFRHSMTVQSQVVGNVQADAHLLADLVARSQGAEGSLQASQATNQLLALTAKQQMQLQQMMAAQFRVEALEQARRATQAAEARVATEIPWLPVGLHARLIAPADRPDPAKRRRYFLRRRRRGVRTQFPSRVPRHLPHSCKGS